MQMSRKIFYKKVKLDEISTQKLEIYLIEFVDVSRLSSNKTYDEK